MQVYFSILTSIFQRIFVVGNSTLTRIAKANHRRILKTLL